MNAKWIVIAMIGTGLAFTPLVHAAENGHHDEHGAAGKHEEKPTTLPGIWHEIQEHQELLASTIKAKKLDDVHKVAFAIRDLAKLLPDKSKDLSAENHKKLKTYIAGIEARAKKLDEFGDAGDQANTEKEAQSLDTLLGAIEKLYPANALKHAE